MRRRAVDSDEAVDLPGQDSFLDIIANIVGILILLVMIVGVRAAMLSPSESASPVAQLAGDTDDDQLSPISLDEYESRVRQAKSQRDAIVDSASRIAHLVARNELRRDERLMLATHVAEFEQEIERRRQRLDSNDQRSFDVRRQLLAAQQELDQLTRQQIALANQTPERVELKNEPTPIGRTVGDNEVIFRLKNKRVVLVPVTELMDEFERREGYRLGEIIRRNGAYGTIGPIGNFRMHYEIVHRRLSGGMISAAPFIEFKPTSDSIGEPIDAAMASDSEFMRRISRANPRREAVTFFVYPDSYGEYRKLREFLREQGFAIAARPLHQHAEIASSPFGRKSVAQ
jgi:hypothetical protein